jgi:UDP-N-acetylglucosamine--N-acetylmuramyl-(pentapeptide) pyrophosphoryl-undecaprenol N-acetylglucosamine transferase
MRIIFAGGGTGGHLYPGLAIARALVKLEPRARPLFIGALRGVERDVLPESGFDHLLLDLHPFYRRQPLENWRTLVGLFTSFSTLSARFQAERPAVVVGTGGYASGAALFAANAMKIPYALQEQNSEPGLVTKYFAGRAKAIFIGVPEIAAKLKVPDPAVIVETGNPIEPPPVPRPDRGAARRAWGFPEQGAPVLLVFGGSQGARALNEVMDKWIDRGLPDALNVIWGTGKADYDRYKRRASAKVVVRAYLSPIADAYAAADLAVTRAGALTLAELCAWGIPSVIVPLPTAAADHQTFNARSLEAAGACVVLTQDELTVDRLANKAGVLSADASRLGALSAAALRRARPNAAEDIARRVLAIAGSAPART